MAERLKIEPSYLSRFFSDPSVHFSEELLFMVLKDLKMNNLEIERVFTLRELERSSFPERKKYLEEKLQLLRAQKILSQIGAIKQELVEIIQLIDVKK